MGKMDGKKSDYIEKGHTATGFNYIEKYFPSLYLLIRQLYMLHFNGLVEVQKKKKE